MKTTTFGAFVELVKGTDGLLHISNVKPGERVDTVEDVLSQGDEIDVTVVEVDKERGRIGLRLSEDPASPARPPRSSQRSAPATRDGGGGGGGGRTAATAAVAAAVTAADAVAAAAAAAAAARAPLTD